jgi:hypothetical protein
MSLISRFGGKKVTSVGKWIRAAISLTAMATAAIIGTGSLGLASDIFTFDPIPASGDVAGLAGSTVGWGYSITNESATDWLLTINLVSDTFLDGTVNLLFDFPEVAPGATVAESFDPVDSIGLYELTWDPDAPTGFVNSGNFVLSAQWYDGDPFNGGNYIADAPDTNAAYSATVSGSGVPEPASFLLIVAGLAVLGAIGIWPRLVLAPTDGPASTQNGAKR